MILGMAVTAALAVWHGSQIGHVTIGPIFSVRDLIELALFAAVIFGGPAYGLMLLLLCSCVRSVLERPTLWCAGVPTGISLILVAAAYPWSSNNMPALAIALGAWVSGGAFLLWHRLRPLRLPA